MGYKVEVIEGYFMAGKSMSMSILKNKTALLWKEFIPELPAGIKQLHIPKGKYTVFNYKEKSSEAF